MENLTVKCCLCMGYTNLLNANVILDVGFQVGRNLLACVDCIEWLLNKGQLELIREEGENNLPVYKQIV